MSHISKCNLLTRGIIDGIEVCGELFHGYDGEGR